jgi:CheY-like chemotaxis protein
MLEGLRILLVEDYVDHRTLYQSALEEHGALVTAVGAPAEALEELRRATYHVLVSDIVLIDGDGYQLIRRVGELGLDRGGELVAMALTAWDSDDDRRRALEAGFAEHCPKLCSLDEFVVKVAVLAGRAPTENPKPLRA